MNSWAGSLDTENDSDSHGSSLQLDKSICTLTSNVEGSNITFEVEEKSNEDLINILIYHYYLQLWLVSGRLINYLNVIAWLRI